MKRIFVLAALLLGATILYAQDAASIVHSSRNRIQSDTISSRSRMVITAKNGSTSERLIDQYSKDGPNGGRTVIVFQQPKNVAGTRFLTMDTASGGTDQWIYLPELGKVRRIAASESSGSFMGTDFSYDDISAVDREASLDNHKLLREETFNGNVCYVIESIPKDSSFQYSKTVSWIDKEKLLSYKVELYNRRGEHIKLMEMSNFEDKQGRLTPMQTKVSTVGAGTSTTIFMEIIKYDDRIPETVFTTTYLETGRAQ
ncbi:MAG: outer membrane lipoprotein-sorting protein [Treponema sp.]|jgi:outer membrane lipoprotein-sorting protein|nr:outer membrane lipoprotein-sorting protein [Treponema sp.]